MFSHQSAISGWQTLGNAIIANAAIQVDIEDSFADFDEYKIILSKVVLSAQSNINLRLKFAGVYDTAFNYRFLTNDWFGATTSINGNKFILTRSFGLVANSEITSEIFIKSPFSSVFEQVVHAISNVSLNTTTQAIATMSAKNITLAPLQGLRLYPESGFISGEFYLQGRNFL